MGNWTEKKKCFYLQQCILNCIVYLWTAFIRDQRTHLTHKDQIISWFKAKTPAAWFSTQALFGSLDVYGGTEIVSTKYLWMRSVMIQSFEPECVKLSVRCVLVAEGCEWTAMCPVLCVVGKSPSTRHPVCLPSIIIGPPSNPIRHRAQQLHSDKTNVDCELSVRCPHM